jgi:outer membrane autotransporter protein
VLVTGYIYSGQSTWTNNGTGSWSDFASWDVPGGTPGLDGVLSVNDTATFGAAGSGTVVLDTNASLLEVVFSNSSASYVVSGSGTLTMAASGTNNPTIANQAGSHAIAAALSLADSTSFAMAPGTDLHVAGVVSGPGAINKTGGGTLILSGSNTYSGGTKLDGGTLVATSPTALGRGEVTLAAGTLSIQAALEVTGLTWSSNATIAIPDPSAGHFVNVSGELNLLGPGRHFFDLSGATVNQPVKLLAAPGLKDNELSIFGFQGLDDDAYELAYIGDELWLVLINPPVPPPPKPEKPKYPDFTQFAVNPNQFQVAQALNQWVADDPRGDRREVLDALVASGDYRQAFDAMMPALYASLPAMAFNQANALNSGMFQRLWVIRINGQGFSSMGLDPVPLQGKSVVPDAKSDFAVSAPEDTKWGAFADGNGIFANGAEVANLQNYRSQSGGVSAGASYKWTDTLATGVYVGYQGLQAQYDNGRTTDQAVRFGVFGTYEIGGVYFNALVGGAYHDYTVDRDIKFGSIDRTATGRPGAGEFDLALGTGYDFKAGDFTFGPFTTMQYTYLGVQGFTETGADSLNLKVDPYHSSSLLYTLGAQAGYNWKVSPAVIVTPTLFAGWQHEFLQDAYRINSSFNTGGPAAPFSYNTGTPPRDNFYGGAGVTFGLGERWQATAIYSSFVGGGNRNSQNVYLGLGLNF